MRPVTAIGRWSTRRPWLAIGCWLGFVAFCVASLVVDRNRTRSTTGRRQSARGYALIDQNRLWHSPARARLPPQRAAARRRPGVPGRDPGRRRPRRRRRRRAEPTCFWWAFGCVSRDRHSALVVVALGDVRASTVRARDPRRAAGAPRDHDRGDRRHHRERRRRPRRAATTSSAPSSSRSRSR